MTHSKLSRTGLVQNSDIDVVPSQIYSQSGAPGPTRTDVVSTYMHKILILLTIAGLLSVSFLAIERNRKLNKTLLQYQRETRGNKQEIASCKTALNSYSESLRTTEKKQLQKEKKVSEYASEISSLRAFISEMESQNTELEKQISKLEKSIAAIAHSPRYERFKLLKQLAEDLGERRPNRQGMEQAEVELRSQLAMLTQELDVQLKH